MRKNRIIFHEGVVDRYSGQHALFQFETEDGNGPGASATQVGRTAEPVIAAVRAAVSRLDPDQQDLIYQVYVLGRTLPDLADTTGLPHARLAVMHRRVKRRLCSLLAAFVNQRFGLDVGESVGCPICRHPGRGDIDRIIAAKRPDQSWRPIMRAIREQTALDLRSPHALIGHARYHLHLAPWPDTEQPDTNIIGRNCHER